MVSGKKELASGLFITIAIGLALGTLMAFVSNAFVYGVAFLTSARSSGLIEVVWEGTAYDVTSVLTLVCAAFIIYGIRRYLALPRFYGPADSIHAAHRTDNELDVKGGLGSTLVAFVAAGGGASVGQYGPLVHFGATIGSWVKSAMRFSMPTDIFIGCGVAAAIAAGFNAPLGGLVFALEAILRHFSLRAVAPIAIASITGAAVSQGLFGDRYLVTMQAPAVDLMTMIGPALFTGLFFGLIAVLFIFLIRAMTRLAGRTGLGPLPLALTAAVICGSVGVFIPDVLGLGTDSVKAMIGGAYTPAFMTSLLISKLAMTALCLGFGLFGGVFSPALFIGAAAGGTISILFGGYADGALTSVLIISGMAAVVAPVIGAPIAVILIILEFTQSYDMAVLAMMAVVTSSLISHVFYGASIFDRQLMDRGIDIHRGRGHLELMETPLARFVHQDYVALSPRGTVAAAKKKLIAKGHSEGYVIGAQGRYIGKITFLDIEAYAPNMQLAKIADEAAMSIKSDASLLQAIEVASDFIGESIPVVDRSSQKMIGIVTEGDLFTAYLATQNRVIDIEGK